jgi:hypothetical protein
MRDFLQLFEPGFVLRSQSFYVVSVGTIELPTGRIVACDPLVCPETTAFTRTVPAGRYDVSLAISVEANGDERTAAALIRFGDAKVVRWELALLPGQELSALRDGEYFAYGVDAGLGCFMDVAAQELLLAELDRLGVDVNYFDDVLDDELEKTYKHTRNWTLHRPVAESSLGIAIFSTGWGDGCYASWFGLDAHGTPMVLVTDLQVADLPG